MSENLNSTMNGTQPSPCYWNPTAEKLGKTFAYCLIVLVSLAGNTVMGITVYRTKTMRKPINFLIVNMAMSDLLYPIFLIPRAIQRLYINSWLIGGPLGQVLCKLVFFLPEVSLSVSIQSLVLIAVDRFGVVVYPLRSPLISSKLCPFFILATWIVALALFSPYLFSKLVQYPGRLACRLHWNEVFGEFFENYYVAFLIILIIIAFLLITILYIIIYAKLKSQNTVAPGQQSASVGQQRQQRERNVLKMATAIVLMFAVCWLPFTINWLLSIFASDILSCSSLYFSDVAFFMMHINCVINPSICFIFSSNYRDRLKTLFR
ncbi:neuropeptide FF receptor 2-like [Orbicella faveolata]|uniref:neuropeptide FF receptor 2-like n=1 Tax=Orbicella faveolata TaxID=48498 RepID=UPI0009E52307|nr:neuropeptide FF receptor 2-like [Orbicella faveolata]